MEKVLNFRDLGGIITENGAIVKKGLFYRCANLDFATDEDVKYLQSLKLNNIVDFRYESELGDQSIYDKLQVKYHNRPINLKSAKICNLDNNRNLKTALIPIELEDMKIAYRNLPFGNSSYHKLIDLVRQDKTPILFHCTVGKDRAGVAAAILLLLLGVSREEIIKDYVKTKAIEPIIIKYITGKINILVRRVIAKKMMPIFLADESYIEAALDEILAKYPSFDSYIMQEYSISKEELNNIRKRYTKKK